MKRRYLTFPALLGLSVMLLVVVSHLMATLLDPAPVSADDSVSVTVNLVSEPGEGGSIQASPAGPYEAGDTLSLTAVPANGDWRFTGWTSSADGLIEPTALREPTVQIQIPEGYSEITITAGFIFCHQLERISNPLAGGTIDEPTVTTQKDVTPPVCTPSPPYYAKGTELGLEAVPAIGYDFTTWSNNVTGTTALGAVTMNGASALIQVTASFAKGCRTLELTSSDGGGDPVPDKANSPGCSPGQYKGGEVITFTANPAAGYRVLEWIGTNSGSNVLTFPDLAKDASHTVTVTYVQKPTIQFSSASYSVNENVAGGAIQITVTRGGNSDEVASVTYTVTPGSATVNQDYQANPASGTLTFAKGDNSETFSIKILDDNLREGNETVNLGLSNLSSNAQYGANKTATLQIVDDESPPQLQFETADYEIEESETTIPVMIKLAPPSAKIVGVTVNTVAGSATAGLDYVGITNSKVFFSPGEDTQTVNVTIKGDELDEADEETFQLVLSAPVEAGLGVPAATTIKVIDNDEPPTVQFSSNAYFALVGDAQEEIQVTLSEASGKTVTVEYTAVRTSGGTLNNNVLEFPPGQLTGSFTVDIAGSKKGDQFLLQLGSAQNATLGSPSSANLYVLDTTPEDCRLLTFEFTGYGLPPQAANLDSSLGCPAGQYVAGELIAVTAQPAVGWRVASWQGTNNDDITSLENVVIMPDADHVVSADYLTDSFIPVVRRFDFYPGPEETEPNNTFVLSNGPLQPGKEYFGGFPEELDLEDRFFFQLTSKADVVITLEDIPSGRDYDLLLYDVNWARGEIDQSRNFQNRPEKITISLEPGKYYIRVLPGESAPTSAKYRLKVAVN